MEDFLLLLFSIFLIFLSSLFRDYFRGGRSRSHSLPPNYSKKTREDLELYLEENGGRDIEIYRDRWKSDLVWDRFEAFFVNRDGVLQSRRVKIGLRPDGSTLGEPIWDKPIEFTDDQLSVKAILRRKQKYLPKPEPAPKKRGDEFEEMTHELSDLMALLRKKGK